MRELILEKIFKHWDDSVLELFDIDPTDITNTINNLTDEQLLTLYNTLFEYNC